MAGLVTIVAVLLTATPAGASPAPSTPARTPTPTTTGTPTTLPPKAPKPTSTEVSPGKPDPHPPAGGIGPDGQPVGGAALLSRGVVVPAGAPKLPKGLTAHAWMLTDLDTGAVLAARDPHGRYQPASILKTLTSLVLLPRLAGSTVVTVGADATNADGSAVGLVAGGKYTVDTLFKAMLLMSGNDAATALADAGGGVKQTVAAMNREIIALGGYDTLAQTPSGLDGWQQLTSAYDMSLVLRAVADLPRFLGYDRTLIAKLPAQRVQRRAYRAVPLANQSENFLDGVPGALFAKTGFTDAAAHTYLCAAQRGGRRLGVVFLRAERYPKDQYQQAAALLSWGYQLAAGAQVGELAGPVRQPEPTRTTPSASTASAGPPAAPTAAAHQATRRSTSAGLPWWLGSAAVVLVAVGALTARRRARRS
ncbi:MAG: D-alanyl-D-alanine carboxypeptidase family protein [Jatrophihabitans sp.]